jgi:ATP-dependent RNA helicase SUPV3L1/SUV3
VLHADINSAIKRVIFEAVVKRSHDGFEQLSIPQLKQIAGRAGRYRTSHQATAKTLIQQESCDTPDEHHASLSYLDDSCNKDVVLPTDPVPVVATDPSQDTSVGYVTTFDVKDLKVVRKAMISTVPPITAAGVFPPKEIIRRFCDYFPPETPLSMILAQLMNFGTAGSNYFVTSFEDMIEIADAIHSVKGLDLDDRITICFSPAPLREADGANLTRELASAIAAQTDSGILGMKSLNLELLDRPVAADKGYLKELEYLHKGLVLYCWLSYRFAGVFIDRALAMHIKDLVENAIDKCLAMWKFDLPNQKWKKYLQKAEWNPEGLFRRLEIDPHDPLDQGEALDDQARDDMVSEEFRLAEDAYRR